MSVVSDIVKGVAEGGTAPIDEVLALGRDLIDRIFPDKNAQAAQRAEAEQHLLDVTAQRQSALLAAIAATDAAQSNVNAIEAASPSLFKSGWRPAIGWVCAGALALNYWPRAIAAVTLWIIQCVHAHALVSYPDLGIADLVGLTSSLLGMSVLRSVEVQKGVR